MAWPNLLHRLNESFSEIDLSSKRILLLLSGGLDSRALFEVFLQLRSAHGFVFSCLHFHHGGQNHFRDESMSFCHELCLKNQIEFQSIKSEIVLNSESEMRTFRREKSWQYAEENSFDYIATAHHADDLLETRLFRLMRGTGLQGFVSMRAFDSKWWKPILMFHKNELADFLNQMGAHFVEDPSNLNLDYDRNWIRHELIPFLQNKNPGSSRHLSSFFNQVAELAGQQNEQLKIQADKWIIQGGIPLESYLSLSKSSRMQWLASYFLALGIKDYSQGHLEEILKHLDKSEKRHRFRVAKCDWEVANAKILAVPRGFET